MKRYMTLLLLLCISGSAFAENSLQTEILSAVRSGKKEIVLKQKEYALDSSVILDGLNGITIDGDHARIVMKQLLTCFHINRCANLTFRNMSIDYDPLPYTQGVVTKVKGKEIEFTIDRGYPPAKGVNYTWNAHAFTPDGKFWKNDVSDIYAKPIPLDPRRFRLLSKTEHPHLDPGDRIALLRHAPGQVCINMRETKELIFENITVYASPGCTFMGYHCYGGDILRNVKVTRGPTLPGAEVPRLLSTNHDAVHYGYCRKGAKLIQCEFAWMGDDSLNFHGKTLVLAEATGAHTFNQLLPGKISDSLYLKRFRKGDKIRILDRENFRILGEYSFVSYRKIEKQYPKEFRDRCFPHMKKHPEDMQSVFEITVAEELRGIPPGSRWDVPDINCRGYLVSNCFFHDHRARGLRVMTSDGVIEKCRFERIKGPAIAVGAQYSGWGEAGWVRNIIVRDNVIRDCQSYLTCGASRSYVPGAIAVFVQLSKYGKIVPEHRDIMIQNNRIENCPGAGIFVMAADNVVISGNRIVPGAELAETPGKALGFTGFSQIWILDSGKVTLSGNQIVSNPGKCKNLRILDLKSQIVLVPQKEIYVSVSEFHPVPDITVDRPEQMHRKTVNVPGMHHLWTGKKDFSAEVFFRKTPSSLIMKCVVTDDIHHQPYKGSNVWRADNIQMMLLFPGENNFWECGFTCLKDNQSEVFFWSKGNYNAPVNLIKLKTKRDEKKKQTVYEAELPWKAFGLKKAPSFVKFNLLFNENDGSVRKVQAAVSGSGQSIKDPAKFYILNLETISESPGKD